MADTPAESRNSDTPVPQRGRTPSRRNRGPMIDLGGGRIVAHQPGRTVSTGRSMADICIVFDTTGSMSDKIDKLIECMAGFVDELDNLSLDWRTSVAPFGDLTVPGDRVEHKWPFATTVEHAKAQLRQMPRFSGGGNMGESSIEAMLGALDKPWRPGAVRVVVLLTDEPALGENRAYSVLTGLQEHEVVTFVASPDLEYFKTWAKQTGGKWFKIGQSMDTGNLLSLLRGLTHQVAITAAEVHAIAGGDYKKYLKSIGTGNRRQH
jgi:hypothetical protein